MNQVRIEEAKSWFVLAQLAIIISGFFFASAGIAWSNAFDTLHLGIGLGEKATSQNCAEINNVTAYQDLVRDTLDYYGYATESNLKLWKTYFELGIIFMVFALVFWLRGRWCLSRIRNRKT